MREGKGTEGEERELGRGNEILNSLMFSLHDKKHNKDISL